MHLFIFGLGYSSLAIARLAMLQGFTVSGTTRSAKKAGWFSEQGIRAFTSFDGFIPGEYSHILSSIPPQVESSSRGAVGDVAIQLFEALDCFADARNDGVWLGTLSTTGVYGDYGGEWVDEESETRPNNARLERRVAAEGLWRARGGHVFRLAGIYGPGRSAIDDIQDGTARRIDKPGQVFSRTHVLDIAKTVLASMLKPNPGNVYNVCDDLPTPSHEVVEYGCQLLGVKPPPLVPFGQAELSAMGREFYAANRRVKNAKIKQELGVELDYPTYREGLAQCLQSSGAEWYV